VGAFLAFTVSQAGMVLHWWREQGWGWQSKAALNGLGALATGIDLVMIGASKFAQGAWITVLVLPLLVLLLLHIHAHYRQVAQQLTMEGFPPPAPPILCPTRNVRPSNVPEPGTFLPSTTSRSLECEFNGAEKTERKCPDDKEIER
jgi:hypothetical protein